MTAVGGSPCDVTRLDDSLEENTFIEEPEQEEAAVGQADTMFAFDIPKCSPGVTLKVMAPDGVTLHIPLPKGVYTGDRLCMEKKADGKWGIKHIERNEMTAIEMKPDGQIVERSAADIKADLADSNTLSVCLKTSKGDIRLQIVPSWAPRGSHRFMQLVASKFYSDVAIYRAVPNFLIQFGLVSDPERKDKYEAIQDDIIRGVPIEDGSICFAAAGPNTRSATVCIFLDRFPQLGKNPWETPIGKVAPESMGVLHRIFTGYGDMPQCGGGGPDPIELEDKGNDYILKNFPECDFVSSAQWL